MPTPTFTLEQAQTAQQIINQLHSNQFNSNQAYFASLAFFNPFPWSWKFAIYHFLSSLPIPHLPTIMIIILFIFGPFLALLLLFGLVFLTYKLIKWLISVLVARFSPQLLEKTFLQITFPADTSKSAYATEQVYKLIHTLARRKISFFQPIKTYSLEIVATKEDGIVYIIGTPVQDTEVLSRSLLSYVPGIHIKKIPDYLSKVVFEPTKENSKIQTSINEADKENEEESKEGRSLGVVELQFTDDYALPLQNQKALTQHDPISFLIGNMTKLEDGELIAFQLVTSPSMRVKIAQHTRLLRNAIAQNRPLTQYISKKQLLPGMPHIIWFLLNPLLWLIMASIKLLVYLPYLILSPTGPQSKSYFATNPDDAKQNLLNPYEQDLAVVIKEKLSQHLFESSIRILILANNAEEFAIRESGLVSSFGQFTSSHQSFIPKNITAIPWFSTRSHNKRLLQFATRSLGKTNIVLSSSELSDLYHFPNSVTSLVEGLAKSKSHELPAPLSMRKNTSLDVVVGENTYGGERTPVGLTKTQRGQHTYIIGKTGTGKSTIIEGMALQDIQAGKGVCVIDPHGDMIEHLLRLIPASRQKDVVYLNPADKAFPVGLNILNPRVSFSDQEELHAFIARQIMGIFMKITPEKNWGQRMEHILRNAVLTVLQMKSGTPETPYISLFAIQKLLTDDIYRKHIIEDLSDPILKQFWKKEFNQYRKSQQAEIISPLTNKIGEFITDPLTRHIVLQEESTINISEIMDKGKILLVNLSKGNLGEERSAFFGTVITSLIQLAVYERSQTKEEDRSDFFVYIDEFQNFATPLFITLFSEARKYHVFFIPSHQNIAQIDDSKVAKIMQGNAGTLIVLRGSPDDEKTILPYLEPEVNKGQIVNLPLHHFFMKVTTDVSEDAFTGVTMPIKDNGSETVAKKIIARCRIDYSTERNNVEEQLKRIFSLPSISKKTKKSVRKDSRKSLTHRHKKVAILTKQMVV